VNPAAFTQQFASAGVTHELRSTNLRDAVRQVYEHLAAQRLRYETAAIDFANYHEAEQVIRPPKSMVAEGANCLELSLLFAGLCLHHKLRALVVLLDDHALAAVWLGGDLDTVWTTGRPAAQDYLIMSGGLGNMKPLSGTLHSNFVELVGKEEYLVIECTGFAYAGYGKSAKLTFEEAVKGGLKRVIQGNLANIVDIGFLLQNGPHRPYPLPESPPPLAAAAPETVPEQWLSDVGRNALGAALNTSVTAVPQLDEFIPRQRWSRSDIGRLRRLLHEAQPCLETEHLLDLTLGLDRALGAREFITSWNTQAVTQKVMRRALLYCTRDLRNMEPQGLFEHLDTVVVRRPDTDADARTALLTFVLHLAAQAGIDTSSQEFTDWCNRDGYDIGKAHTLRNGLRAQRRDRHHRLLIHLWGKPAHDWPEEGAAWLLDETTGRLAADSLSLSCAPGADGVAALISRGLDWAHGLPQVTTLPRVDIAIPARTLLHWRSEEADLGPALLGANHEVVVHWGDRIRPPQHLKCLTYQARYRLLRLEEQDLLAGGRVDWVRLESADDQSALRNGLKKGAYPTALGLRTAPIGHEDFFEELLAQFPVLLWPERAVPEWAAVEKTVREQWVNLPGGFSTAYRTAWMCSEAEIPPLARLRAVWDNDPHWIAFCSEMGEHKAGIAPTSGAGTGGQS
jgi:hypothetical protein